MSSKKYKLKGGSKMANKKDVVERVAGDLEVSKKAAGDIVNTVMGAMKDLFVQDGELRLVGLATFHTKVQSARKAKNPSTGEPIDVPAKMVPKIRFAKALKEEIKAVFPQD
jgi:DNA-binding protein HU-beta